MTIVSSKRQNSKEAAAEVIRSAANRWPTTFIARSRVPEFTGGLVAVGTLANCDSAGTGVRGAFKLGRQVAYPIDALVEWLIGRMEV